MFIKISMAGSPNKKCAVVIIHDGLTMEGTMRMNKPYLSNKPRPTFLTLISARLSRCCYVWLLVFLCGWTNAIWAVNMPCASPVKRDDGWLVTVELVESVEPVEPFKSAESSDLPAPARASLAGFDQTKLCEVLRGVATSDMNFHSVIVERHGKLVAELYKQGKDESIYTLIPSVTKFDNSTKHDVRSISKSVVSLLWGIAQAQGKTPPLSTPVVDLLPELRDLKGDGREAITIAHLLTMSSGLDWNEPSTYKKDNDEFGLYWRSSQARYVFNRPMAAVAGAVYNYNGGGTAVLAQILADRVGMTLPEYARKFLLEPLGITDWEWKNDFRGRPLAFAGLRMRPRDIARIGRMVLGEAGSGAAGIARPPIQPGVWHGKQIVPAAWLADSTRAQIVMGNEPGWSYGYQWWVGKLPAESLTPTASKSVALEGDTSKPSAAKPAVDWFGGFGNGGQRLFMMPALDIVVVITAGQYGKPEIGPQSYQLLKKIVATARE